MRSLRISYITLGPCLRFSVRIAYKSVLYSSLPIGKKKNTYVSNEGFVNIYIWAVKTQGKRGGQCGRLCTYVRSGRQRFPNFDARPLHPQRIRELLRAENSIEVMLKKKRTTEEETFISKLFVLFSYTFCAFTNYQEIFFCKTYKTGLLNIGFQICVSKIF